MPAQDICTVKYTVYENVIYKCIYMNGRVLQIQLHNYVTRSEKIEIYFNLKYLLPHNFPVLDSITA